MVGSHRDVAEAAAEDIRQRTGADDTFARVLQVALGVTGWTHHSEIAEQANCAPNSAKKHLNRLVGMRVIRRGPGEKTSRYRRNEAYLEWYEVARLAEERTDDEIVARVRELESRVRDLEDQFEINYPPSLSKSRQNRDRPVHERMEALGEWRDKTYQIHLHELAHQVTTNEQRLIPRYRSPMTTQYPLGMGGYSTLLPRVVGDTRRTESSRTRGSSTNEIPEVDLSNVDDEYLDR